MATRWTEADLEKLKLAWHAPRRTPAQLPVKRPSKYGNVKVTGSDGLTHDSRKEYRRWCELELRAKAGEITALRRQVPYALVVNGILVCQYIADAVYEEGAATICEDCKSPQTRKLAAFSIKRKLMQAIHGIQVNEI